jgi:hypothetical protein
MKLSSDTLRIDGHILRKIQNGFDQGFGLAKFLRQSRESVFQSPSELEEGGFETEICFGRNQISHSFCLGQVDSAGQKRTFCEFTWLCLSCTCSNKRADQTVKQNRRTVTLKFNSVFTRVAVWRAGHKDQELIFGLAIKKELTESDVEVLDLLERNGQGDVRRGYMKGVSA